MLYVFIADRANVFLSFRSDSDLLNVNKKINKIQSSPVKSTKSLVTNTETWEFHIGTYIRDKIMLVNKNNSR